MTGRSPIEIVPLGSALHEPYSAFLLGRDESLFYYSLDYKAFLESLLGCRSDYHVALENGEMTGVLPLMEKQGTFGRVINSLPYYGSNGGALGTTTDTRVALREFYSNYTKQRDVGAATWIENPLAPTEGLESDLLDRRTSHFTTLSPSPMARDIFQGIDESARRNVRKAEKSGVTVSVKNDMFRFLEQTHHQNMDAIGGRAKGSDFFSSVPHHFEAGIDYNLYVAERSGRPVAALLLFYFNKTVEYFTPVTVSEERQSQPMAAILLCAMQDAIERNFHRWNWGGTWHSQEGVARFKRKWGAKERTYRYFVTVNDKRILSTSPDRLLKEYTGFYVVPFQAIGGD